MLPTKLESKDDIANAIRRALVEVYTLIEAGRSPADATNALDDRIIPNTSLVSFDATADGSVSLIFPDEQTRQDVLDSTVEAEPLEEVLQMQIESENEESAGTTDLGSVEATPVDELIPESDASVESFEDDTSPSTVKGDDSWKIVTFKDPAIKFAVCNRKSKSYN